jgi:hypothetical protein
MAFFVPVSTFCSNYHPIGLLLPQIMLDPPYLLPHQRSEAVEDLEDAEPLRYRV